MKYFFIFGNHPDLSFLELTTKLQSEHVVFSLVFYKHSLCILELTNELPSSILMGLGGLVKYGLCFASSSRQTCHSDIVYYLSQHLAQEKRLTFGLSSYTKKIPVHRLGIEIKKELKTYGGSIRFVAPKRGEYTLSSVSVEKNNLLHSGNNEVILFDTENELLLGKTLFVQQFETYSFRDWSRPARDMETGLIPPKLAQMMINVAGLSPQTNPKIHDPFCGFGTILQEALMMGYTHVSGSDISNQRIADSQKNHRWLFNHHLIRQTTIPLFNCDVKNLSRVINNHSLDAIITEPYLGPITKKGKTISQSLIKELSLLYKKSFEVFASLLKKNGVVVFLFPVWQTKNGPLFIPLFEEIFSLGFINNTIPEKYSSYLHSKTTRNTFLYMRPGQGVAREIGIFRLTH